MISPIFCQLHKEVEEVPTPDHIHETVRHRHVRQEEIEIKFHCVVVEWLRIKQCVSVSFPVSISLLTKSVTLPGTHGSKSFSSFLSRAYSALKLIAANDSNKLSLTLLQLFHERANFFVQHGKEDQL